MLKLCMCAQSLALATRTKFQLEILIRSISSAIYKFQENILESSLNVSETPPRVTIRDINCYNDFIIGFQGTDLHEIWIKMQYFSFKELHVKMFSA